MAYKLAVLVLGYVISGISRRYQLDCVIVPYLCIKTIKGLN